MTVTVTLSGYWMGVTFTWMGDPNTDPVNLRGHDTGGGRELFLVGRSTTALPTFFPVLSRVVSHLVSISAPTRCS